jgi:hypothetical protein
MTIRERFPCIERRSHMLRRVFVLAMVAAGLGLLCAQAPGGPGDASPIGPWPYNLIHQPPSIAAGTQSVHCWVHALNMPDGEYTALNNNGYSAQIITWTQYYRGNGTWDEDWYVSIGWLKLRAGGTLNWCAGTTDMTDYSWYSTQASTNVTGG